MGILNLFSSRHIDVTIIFMAISLVGYAQRTPVIELPLPVTETPALFDPNTETEPLSVNLHKHKRSNLEKLLNAKKWNELFPNRNGRTIHTPKNDSDFYSFKAFALAARAFPKFLTGDIEMQKHELAAFLANIAQETSGGWPEAEGGYFKWGLYYVEELYHDKKAPYIAANNKKYPPVEGQNYYGRGPKQLSWNYNYGQFSEAWFGTKDSLLNHPDLLAIDPVVSFASAIWFWMTPQRPKPSCHAIMHGDWIPTEIDIQKGRRPGFGATVNVINGGVECGKGIAFQKTKNRYDYYRYFCDYLKVPVGENVECTDQLPFSQ